MPHIAYIGIGSNLGDKIGQCQRAISKVLKIPGHRLLAQSSLYRTQPLDYLEQDWFVNGVIKIETNLTPFELFNMMKEIEFKMGRKKTFPGGPRVIDLDLLFYDDQIIQTDELQIPHPRLIGRQFVLYPLMDIDPFLVHPILRKTVKELLSEIKVDQGVKRI
ncbi:MAG: 2-amino-4-hydroxy-6-hydroxymethyldihydropteridine diphosphokinase [Thermodesulfobacteriota bacterium]